MKIKNLFGYCTCQRCSNKITHKVRTYGYKPKTLLLCDKHTRLLKVSLKEPYVDEKIKSGKL